MDNLKHFYTNLTLGEREAFASSVFTTDTYIRHFLIPRRRTPSASMIRRMVRHSNGSLNFLSLLCDVFPELERDIGIGDGGKASQQLNETPATCVADQDDTTGDCNPGATDHVAPTKALRG